MPVSKVTLPLGAKMNFSRALKELKAGQKLRRAGWNGRGMFIVMMSAMHLPPFNTQGTDRKVNDRTARWIGEDTPLDSQPYIAMFTALRQWQPGWLCSQADIFAEDWEIADERECVRSDDGKHTYLPLPENTHQCANCGLIRLGR